MNTQQRIKQAGRTVKMTMMLIGFTLMLAAAVEAATFHVTTTADNGDDNSPTPGSLRKAIKDANTNAGADTIDFQIPGAGVKTISPPASLPTITSPVTIDGYTQPGASPNTLAQGDNAVLLIEINGANAGADAYCFRLGTNNNLIRGLIINRFGRAAIIAGTVDANTIEGNFIGTDATGTVALPNYYGIDFGGSMTFNLIGGSAPAARNLISGNGEGIFLRQGVNGQVVLGNYIGTDRNGTAALPNQYHGLFILSTNNLIGGVNPGSGNLVSGNKEQGIFLSGTASGNLIRGNLIGVNAAGTAALPNGAEGMDVYGPNNTIGGVTAEARNVISGNKSSGIGVYGPSATGNLIQGNLIGVDISSFKELGNGNAGVDLTAGHNTIGGLSNAKNIIAYNTGNGVQVRGSLNNQPVQNSILGNRIFNNGKLGINLGDQDTVDPNDPGDGDTGHNNRQNYPEITSAHVNGVDTTITGTLNSTANTTFRVEFFRNNGCDDSGYGEGSVFLDAKTVQTSGNNGAFNVTLPLNLPPGQRITATATDADGNTSEFSRCVETINPMSGTFNFSSPTYTVNESDGTATITVTRTGGSTGTVYLGYRTISGGTATPNVDYLPKDGEMTVGDGVVSVDGQIEIKTDLLVEGDETIILEIYPLNGAVIGNQNKAVLTIKDDPPPTVSVSDVSLEEGNQGQGVNKSFDFKVTLSKASAQTVTVNYTTTDGTAATGSDYQGKSGTVTFAPGEVSATVPINVSQDTQLEPDETFFLTLSSPNNAMLGKKQGTGTILNDDGPQLPTLQFSQPGYNVTENMGGFTVVVTRTGDLSAPATVKYSTDDLTDVNFNCDPNTPGQATIYASRKCDYHIAAGTLRFAAGEASRQFTLSLIDDIYVEGPETMTLKLSNPTGATIGQDSSVVVAINDDDTPGKTNPVEQTSFFVRQLYVDLLSREPDPAGLTGWSNRIDLCGLPGQPPPPCDRVTVAGDGFMGSAEFFDRQFFVIRLYRTGLGRIPIYGEVGDLAYVSGFLTPADLELNKQDLVAELMARPEFSNSYDGLNNAQFIDKLILTAGVSVPDSDRTAWFNALNSNSKTRAQVFREISERAEVVARYLHEAQVISCYYGFFTRNPDAAYLIFLQRLDNGEITLSDLANAFVNSAEYRQRFGQ